MRLPGSLVLHRAEVWQSLSVGVGFAILAFLRSGSLAMLRRRAEVCVWLALCIRGVHFTGMAALTLTPPPGGGHPAGLGGSGPLAAGVGAVSHSSRGWGRVTRR